MKVEEIMLETKTYLQEEVSLMEAAQFMKEHGLRRAFVVNATHYPVGIISTSDIVFKIVAQGEDPKSFAVKDIMSGDILVFKKDDDVTVATVKLEEKGKPSAAIVEGEHMVGVISLDACIHACLDMLQKKTQGGQ